MGWKSFSDDEILELKSNKYTHTVSTATISFMLFLDETPSK